MANIPAHLSKFFKLTPAAKDKMQATNPDNGRVCELDPNSERRVLTWTAGQKGGFDEIDWSQKRLHEAAQKDPRMRISRKRIDGTSFEIFQRDLYNPPELEKFKDLPNMSNSLVQTKLGFFQAKKHEYIYIISNKSGD